MKHHLHVELAETPSSLLRVVACLHARHMAIEQLRFKGGIVCLELSGAASGARIQMALSRLIDVTVVRDGRPSPEAHPWLRVSACCR
jgi:hypothetical protein